MLARLKADIVAHPRILPANENKRENVTAIQVAEHLVYRVTLVIGEDLKVCVRYNFLPGESHGSRNKAVELHSCERLGGSSSPQGFIKRADDRRAECGCRKGPNPPSTGRRPQQ